MSLLFKALSSNLTNSAFSSIKFPLNSTSNNDYFNIYSWPILFLSFFVFLGFIGNLLVCLAIRMYPKLQTVTNYYLFSLAATDLLVSIIVMPLAIVKNLFETWILGNFVCTLWIFLDVLLCTASIFLLCIIAFDRYVGIKQPFKNIEKSKSKTKQIIFLIGIVSTAFSSPIIVIAHINPSNLIHNGTCVLYNNYFMVYGSIVSFVIPLIIMITMYCLTVRRLRIILKEFNKKNKRRNHMHLELSTTCDVNEKQSKGSKKENSKDLTKTNSKDFKNKNKDKRNDELLSDHSNSNDTKQNHISHSNSENYESLKMKQDPNLSKQICVELKNEETSLKNEVEPTNKLTMDKPKPALSVNCLSAQSNSHQETYLNNIDNKRLSISLRSITSSKKIGEESHSVKKNSKDSIQKDFSASNSHRGSRVENRLKTNKHTFRSIVRRSILLNRVISNFKMSRETAVVKNEQKAVKVLGIVVLVFILAWAPFAFVNIFIGLGLACSSKYDTILNILTWPGYISSVINPLIYSAFNEKFRYAFKEILKCNYDTLKNNDKFRIDAMAKMNLVQSITRNRDRYLFKDKNEYKNFLKKI